MEELNELVAAGDRPAANLRPPAHRRRHFEIEAPALPAASGAVQPVAAVAAQGRHEITNLRPAMLLLSAGALCRRPHPRPGAKPARR